MCRSTSLRHWEASNGVIRLDLLCLFLFPEVRQQWTVNLQYCILNSAHINPLWLSVSAVIPQIHRLWKGVHWNTIRQQVSSLSLFPYDTHYIQIHSFIQIMADIVSATHIQWAVFALGNCSIQWFSLWLPSPISLGIMSIMDVCTSTGRSVSAVYVPRQVLGRPGSSPGGGR